MTPLLVPTPLMRGMASTPSEALGLPGIGFGVATNATCPVGVPLAPEPVTVLLTPMGVPCAMLPIEVTGFPFTLTERAVADGEKVTEDQLLTRFCALTEPRPVTRS